MSTLRKFRTLLMVAFVTLVAFSCGNEPDRITFNGKIAYFVSSSVSVNENSSNPLDVTIEMSKPLQNDVTFDVELTEDTAIEGVDFELSSTSVTIPAGEYSASLQVTPVDNDIIDGARRFNLKITSSSADVELTAEAETSVTILNDDCPVKTSIWTVAKANNAYEVGGDYIYTAEFGPNDAGDCNVLVIHNIGDLGSEARAVMTFTPDFEGATTGTVEIPKQGINSFGSSGERTAEGVGTYDEETKTITIFITFKFGSGDLFYEDETIFDAN